MINVTKMTVRSFNLDHMNVFWEIAPVQGPPDGSGLPHEIYNYDFYILRSEAGAGPYTQLAGPFRDVYSFRDITAELLHKWRQLYYKIKVVDRTTGEEKLFGPASSLEPEPDLIASEIVRQEDLLFREFVGRRSILYPLRTFGPSCSCFDRVTNRKTRSNCKTCFGTGWLGGFLSPVEVFVQIDPFPKNSEKSSLQERQPGNTTARMISFPPVSPGDILIETENRRWRVMTVTPTQRLRSTVRQEMVIHEIPKGDIEFALPVQVDVRGHQPAAERNFTNPQNTDDNDFSDILAVYGRPRGALR